MSYITAWTTPKLFSEELDDRKTGHERRLIAAYLRVSHMKKILV